MVSWEGYKDGVARKQGPGWVSHAFAVRTISAFVVYLELKKWSPNHVMVSIRSTVSKTHLTVYV